MNVRLSRFIVCTGVFTLFLSIGLNSRGQSPAPTNPTTSTNSAASASLLSQAYAALSVADHDYQGHRVRAMKNIEAAAKELGVTLQGGGKGHEQQVVSDQQLRTAQGLLQQALPGLPQKAKNHVERALEQLSTALSIK
jgi:hypothetical protein